MESGRTEKTASTSLTTTTLHHRRHLGLSVVEVIQMPTPQRLHASYKAEVSSRQVTDWIRAVGRRQVYSFVPGSPNWKSIPQ